MPSCRFSFWILAILLINPNAGTAAEPDAKGLDFFEKKIRPVLVQHYYVCHSAEAKKTKGGLALDTRDGLRDGGETGPAVVPGDVAKSILIKALRHDGPKMPNEQKQLPSEVIADFEAWVKMGAPDPRDGKTIVKKGIDYDAAKRHWAYQPVTAPKLPTAKKGDWPARELDRFVLAEIEPKALTPAIDAAPHSWLRRVSFDLTGLPPTLDEVDAFLTDKSPEARTKVVDRLLASPRFGEHWARHWLDGVRFDQGAQTIDQYRDWVVRSLNADLPYDRFITLQLAGDLLPPSADSKEQADRVFATQMLCLNSGEMDPVEGMVEVFGQQVLGVSINCAKCHDHKFDAYSQGDYYALAGVFTSSVIAGTKGPKAGGVEVPGFPGVKVLALVDGSPADTSLLIRGEKSQKGAIVPRQFPIVLAGEKQTPLGQVTKQSGRLELAKWSTDSKNPLTARVMATRVWLRLFGRESSVHPTTLVWLAIRP